MKPRDRTFPACLTALAALLLLHATTLAESRGDTVFVLSYFMKNGQAGVYLAASDDGLVFEPLNGGRVVFAPPQWPQQNLTRDPSIVFRDGLFHMVWTSNWNGAVFGYASSPDLKQWSQPTMVRSFPDDGPQPKNVWAPELHWDPVQQNYLILWSSRVGNDSHRIYATRTSDFSQFTPATRFFDPGVSVIDAYLALDDRATADSADDRWVMITKNEEEPAVGGKNLRLSVAGRDLTSPFPPVFTAIDGSKPWSGPIAGPGSPGVEHFAEGPSLIRHGDRWLLYWDAFANGYYNMASSADLITWTEHRKELRVPPGTRHGTVFLAPRQIVDRLR